MPGGVHLHRHRVTGARGRAQRAVARRYRRWLQLVCSAGDRCGCDVDVGFMHVVVVLRSSRQFGTSPDIPSYVNE